MNCMYKKCKINNNEERMIACWLCLGLIHVKCSGISVLTADAINRYEGVHWCCSNCRKIGVDFYRFFQNRKTTFLNIQKDLSGLANRFEDYGKLFDAFPSLDSFNSPQRSSPKRRKSARNVNKGNNNNLNSPKQSSSVNNEESERICNTSSFPTTSSVNNSSETSNSVKLPVSNNSLNYKSNNNNCSESSTSEMPTTIKYADIVKCNQPTLPTQ